MLLKFIVFLYFSLYRQREVNKRELVARFESEQITILKNCAAGLASLKQVLALPSAIMLSLGIAHASNILSSVLQFCLK